MFETTQDLGMTANVPQTDSSFSVTTKIRFA